ncbi:hypothetical protein ASZ90_018579 [hydrocarbon metagenome]|uniref:DUF2442 domain-containing protein n=1 Tax=hydrocarbon metagenome TaxID=938273 RepID=A0A0W8E626_9ZZZZ
MCHIKKVIPRNDYHLEVQLDNGCIVILNLKSRLGTVRFGMISDMDLFQRAATDGSYIRWGNKVEISVREVFQLAEKAELYKEV